MNRLIEICIEYKYCNFDSILSGLDTIRGIDEFFAGLINSKKTMTEMTRMMMEEAEQIKNIVSKGDFKAISEETEKHTEFKRGHKNRIK